MLRLYSKLMPLVVIVGPLYSPFSGVRGNLLLPCFQTAI